MKELLPLKQYSFILTIPEAMNGWMTCDFKSFLTVFQSYQDDVWMMMKGCVQWNSVYGWEDFTSREDRTQSARSEGQRLTHRATGAPHPRSLPQHIFYENFSVR